MLFRIILTGEVKGQLRDLSARDRRIVEATIAATLTHQPTTPTHAVKKLRPNPFAEFQLRVGEWRVLYNVEADQVVLLAVGLKVGEKFIVEGKEFDEHQDNPPESSGNGLAGSDH